jgi:hypothetical protein
VVANHSDLLRHSSHIGKVEDKLHAVSQRVNALHHTVQKLNADLLTPFHAIERQSQSLLATQLTCETARHILRVLQLHDKLKTQMAAGNRELTKAAQTYHDLDNLLAEREPIPNPRSHRVV